MLSAPQVLDEGVNLPAADLGIILAASQSRRQMVQRMRVLGTSEDPDEGAHGAFLENITDVADGRINFGTIETGDEVCKYLKGTCPQAENGAGLMVSTSMKTCPAKAEKGLWPDPEQTFSRLIK